MKPLAKSTALVGLALTLLPPLIFFFGALELDLVKGLMLAGMILWYAGAAPWLGIDHVEHVPGEDETPRI